MSTSKDFGFVRETFRGAKRTSKNIHKLKTRFGDLYLENVKDELTPIKESKTYRFVSKEYKDLHHITRTTIDEFFTSLSTDDQLAAKLTEKVYKRRWPNPVRILSFKNGIFMETSEVHS